MLDDFQYPVFVYIYVVLPRLVSVSLQGQLYWRLYLRSQAI